MTLDGSLIWGAPPGFHHGLEMFNQWSARALPSTSGLHLASFSCAGTLEG